MNAAIENMLTRRSVRSYKADAIPSHADIAAICEAGLYAASGKGTQCPIIIAITDKALRDRLSRLNAKIMGVDFDPFYGAPAVLVVLVNKGTGLTPVYDGSLTMGNLMLAAHSLGIDSCWIHRAKEEFECDEGKAILKELGIEGDYEGVGHCILGHSAGPVPEARPRNPGRVIWAEGK